MLVIMTGAWYDTPNQYDSIRAYLDGENGKKLEDWTNMFIKEHLPKMPKFVLGDKEKQYIVDYVEKNKDKAYPRADGSFESHRFFNLCDEAIADIFDERNYYEIYK